jgi:hypothetical protein
VAGMKKENFNPRKAMDLTELIEQFSPYQEIKCSVCNKRHFPNEKTFFTFYGNVTIGLFGGMIGNNLNKDGTIGRLSFLCRTKECFKYLTEHLDIDDKEK